MLKSSRTAAGLGCPPGIFTTNSSESLNAAIKRKVNFKESEWPEFNESIKPLVLSQRDEVVRSLSGRGKYRLDKEYAHLIVAPEQWTRMRPEQFDAMKVKCSTTVASTYTMSQTSRASSSATLLEDGSVTDTQVEDRARVGLSSMVATKPSPLVCETIGSTQDDSGTQTSLSPKHMSISAADSNILILPKATLEGMWNKAEEYLQSKVDVVAAPGGNSKVKMVTSRSGSCPHLVQTALPGQYICDKNCIQWMSSQICAHTLVAAEVNSELDLYLQWYNMNNPQPNISQLAMTGLPRGRGRKGGIPKWKYIVVSRAATMRQPPACISVSGTAPAVTTSQFLCGGQSTVSFHMGDNFTNSASLVVNADRSPPLPVQNVVGNSVSTPYLLAHGTSAPSTIPLSSLFQSHSLVGNNIANTPFTHVTPSAPNTNPFYVRFISGNIRICQGCRGSLKCANGTIPAPPFNLCCVRAEKRIFKDHSGVLRTPSKEQPSHYHINLHCIQASAPEFVLSSLCVHPDVLSKLTIIHKEYLRLVFHLILSQ